MHVLDGDVRNVVHSLIAGSVIGLGAGLAGALIGGLPDTPPGIGLQWMSFAIARAWLAARRQLPLRLLRFLEDAYARGVLRQAGAVYQFRHARVREHLATNVYAKVHPTNPTPEPPQNVDQTDRNPVPGSLQSP